MSIIVPTVTAETSKDFISQYNLVSSFAQRIHLDIMDGDFAPTKSPLPSLNIPLDTEIDVHIMYRNPVAAFGNVLSWNPKLIIVHAESVIDIIDIKQRLPANVLLGIALLPETSVESAADKIMLAEHVLIFGGHLGYHGGQSDLSQLNKVEQIRNIKPNIEIAWDGGANLQNIEQISNARVNVINIGSAIHQSSNPSVAYDLLKDKLNS